jgi:uncharacterized membrane protein
MNKSENQPTDAVTAAAAANYGYIDYIEKLPFELLQKEWDRMVKAAGGPNKWGFVPIATADNNPTVKMSPDVLYSALSYDVSERPIRLSVPVSRDPFWSLTLFQANTDNYFGIDDRAVEGDAFDLVVLGPQQSAAISGAAHVVASPTEKGIAIVRMVVSSPDKLAALDKLRKKAKAVPVIA